MMRITATVMCNPQHGKSAMNIAVQNGHKDIIGVLKTNQSKKVSITACLNQWPNSARKSVILSPNTPVISISTGVQKVARVKVFIFLYRLIPCLLSNCSNLLCSNCGIIAQQLHYMKQQKEQIEQQLRHILKQTEQQLCDMRQQKEQTEQQLHDMSQQKEQTEQQLHVMRQQKEQTEQQLHDMRQQKEQTKQQLYDMRQQKELTEQQLKKQINVSEKQVQIITKIRLKNKSLKHDLHEMVQKFDAGQITQTTNFIDYNPTNSIVSRNSSDDEEDL
eukprot:Em0007g1282a